MNDNIPVIDGRGIHPGMSQNDTETISWHMAIPLQIEQLRGYSCQRSS